MTPDLVQEELQRVGGDVRERRVVDRRDGRLVAEGSTVQVMFDYEARRSIPIPEELKAKLASV